MKATSMQTTRVSTALLGSLLVMASVFTRPCGAQAYPSVPSDIADVQPAVRSRPSGPTTVVVPDDLVTSPLVPGSLVRLEVYGAPDMSRDLRVDHNGNISVPLVGALLVAGKSVTDAQAELVEAFADKRLFTHPQITLSVLEYATDTITVLGEVQSPGQVQLVSSRTLEDVLALAGGPTPAAGNVIEVDHQGRPASFVHYYQGGSPEPLRHTMIQRGDSVYVQRAGVVYVLGAVNRPGGYYMVNHGDLSVLQAISLAYGTTLVATGNKFYVIRPNDDGGYTQIQVDYKNMIKGKIPPMRLRSNDILYVPSSTGKSVLINGGGLIGTAATAAIYRTP